MFTKMNQIIDEVRASVAERDELIECIAICLIARKNLFILGDTGQAKSYAINEFRKRITGAKQYERLMSKQTDEEQLFGRLDLSSLIPGNMPMDELMKDNRYAEQAEKVEKLYEQYQNDGLSSTLNDAVTEAKNLLNIKHILCALRSGTPKMITEGKIPDSHIVFLDEIFKSNDGILNSLLTALNEKVYTNEGQTVKIPVESFFSASNEIPNFNDSTQAILKPLYDRFEMKVLTEYVQEKDNRMTVLKNKQSGSTNTAATYITLDELKQMQQEAEKVKLTDEINELMDNVLCELRRHNIHVSDRKYFGFTPIVRVKAYLNGNTEVKPKDLLVLKNYFWSEPSQIPIVEKILKDICENPIGAKAQKLVEMARESFSELNNFASSQDRENPDIEKQVLKLYMKTGKELLRIYSDVVNLKEDDMSDADCKKVDEVAEEIENFSLLCDDIAKTPHVPLSEKMRLNV
ncbi:MAG: AAA family ATPase [Clostridia bacterium]|nr:AAA family ATPase [Clostridia bacterium]